MQRISMLLARIKVLGRARYVFWPVVMAITWLLLVGACTPVKSNRPDTHVAAGDQVSPCGVEVAKLSGEQIRALDSRCQQSALERSKELGYMLNVVEFDDQGRYFSPEGELSQAELVKQQIRKELRSTGSTGVSVVVMVHGWKHSAAMDDSNLGTFRDILGQLSAVEKETRCNRKVMGVYVGWRGRNALFGGPLENVTFWSRKAAAERVANGQIKQLFGDLRALQDTAVPRAKPLMLSPTPEEVATDESEFDCTSRMKMTYLGHSFGGLIVTNATLPTLVREMGEAQEREDLRAWCENPPDHNWAACEMLDRPLPVPDELVIVVNPAVESARFYPLFAIAQASRSRDAYRAPRFISITSDADKATGMAFPLARLLNSATKAYPQGDKTGRQSERLAMGHDPNFTTHLLTSPSEAFGAKPEDQCQGVLPRTPQQSAQPISRDVAQNAPATQAVIQAPMRVGEQVLHYPRNFKVRICRNQSQANKDIQVDLELVPYDQSHGGDLAGDAIANTEVWNIRTADPVVRDHNDFSNRRLLDFLGLLYLESMTKTSVGQKNLNRANPSAVSK